MNVSPRPAEISRIAVFQALQLGDLLCATPAMRALRQHYPQAEITLIGSAWAGDMVARLPSIDRFIPFPGYPGITESPAVPPAATPDWPPFDLAIQMHGAGKVSNGFVASLGAAQSLGHGDPGDDRLTLIRQWQELEREPLRWLHLLELLHVPAAGHHLEFPITQDELQRAERLVGGADERPVVGVHVGASVPGRRWPPGAFATVIDALAARSNCRFVLTGSAAERSLTAQVAAAARTPLIDLAGETTLGEFGAVIAGLDLLLTNDTGASHVAAAVQTPSVVLFGPADPRRWAPLDAARHHVINARDYAKDGDGASALQSLPPPIVLEACLQALRNEPQAMRDNHAGAGGMNRLRVLIWHIHGSYLNSLARVDHDWFLPIKPGKPEGYGGRGPTFDLPDNMVEIPAEQVRDLEYDVVVLQTPRNLHEDLPALLGLRQHDQALLYLEHNTPRPDPVNTRHPFADHDGLLVHVTAYNRLMWDNGGLPTRAIEHSVAIDPAVTYDGSLDRGITVTNGMQGRPRITGLDIFEQARAQVPLDVIGMKTEELGGLGDVPYRDLHRLTARYRFLFSPMRYTSMPLAVVEAMTIGMPVVALGTTALPDVIENGVNGYIAQDPDLLIPHMQRLIADPELARALGERARETARARFGMERFQADWDAALREAIALKHGSPQLVGTSS